MDSIPDSSEKVNSGTKLSRKSSSEKQTSPVLERMERESIADFFLRSAVNEDERDIVRTYYEELDDLAPNTDGFFLYLAVGVEHRFISGISRY